MPYTYSNRRTNPITAETYPRAVEEVGTIALLSDDLPGVYGIQLRDSIVQDTLTVTENVTGGAEFVIVTTTPLAGQVAIRFFNGIDKRGILVFNASDAGTEVLIEYQGLGSLNTRQNIEAIADEAGAAAGTTAAQAAISSQLLIPGRSFSAFYGPSQSASSTWPWHPIHETRTFAQADAEDFVNYLYSVPFEVGGVDEFAITNAAHASGMGTGVQKLTFSSSTEQALMFAALLDMMAFRSYSFTTNNTTAAQLLTISAVSTGSDTVDTSANHLVSTGHPVTLFAAAGGTLPTGISEGIVYYARAVDANTLSFHPTIDDAINNTNIVDITAAGSGTRYIDTRSAKAQLTLSIASTIGHITSGNYAISAIDSSDRFIWITGSNDTAGGAVAGNVQFYKHRIGGSSTSIMWYGVDNVALMSMRSDGSLANGLERLDEMQAHKHAFYYFAGDLASGGAGARFTASGSNNLGPVTDTPAKEMISDGTNGTPRTGAITRPRSVIVETYVYVGENTL